MASKIDFTDTIGAATLTNGKPSPGDRFSDWTPHSRPFGVTAFRQADGASSVFRFRSDFAASFALTQIPSKTVAGIVLADIADRLCFHLMNGGQCSVTTGDAAGSVYATCGIMPNTEATLELSDKQLLEYTLKLSLLNLAGSPVRMVCRYDDQ